MGDFKGPKELKGTGVYEVQINNLLIVGDGFGFIIFEKYPNFNRKIIQQ